MWAEFRIVVTKDNLMMFILSVMKNAKLKRNDPKKI